MRCNQLGECFAKTESEFNKGVFICDCLNEQFVDRKCPFQKPYRFVTDGVYYPFNPKKDPDVLPYEFIEEEDREEVIAIDPFNIARKLSNC